jgi:N utilization substance protein A
VEQQMSALVGSAATPLESVTGLGEGLVEKLQAAGVTTVEALADMTPEQLEAIEGIGPKTVEKISLAVNNYFSSLESGEVVAAASEVEGVAEPPAEGEAPGEETAAELSAEAATEDVDAVPESESAETAAVDETPAAAGEAAEGQVSSDDKQEHEK